MTRRFRLTVVLGLLLGLLALGVIWGLVAALTTLAVAVVAAGLMAQVVLDGRVDLESVLVAGAVGAVLAVVAVSVVGLPSIVRVGGVPILWAAAGATLVLAALRVSPKGSLARRRS